MSVHRFLIVAIGALSMLAAAGCQSSSAPAGASISSPPTKAIVVSDGNGGSITVFVPSADREHADVLYASNSGETCADCRQAAAHYFLTGELVAKCPTCGATRTVVTYVTPNVGHN